MRFGEAFWETSVAAANRRSVGIVLGVAYLIAALYLL